MLYWELEAEKKRSPRAMTNKPTSTSSSKPSPSTQPTTTNKKEEKERPNYADKRKAELSAKGPCFICEQTGQIAHLAMLGKLTALPSCR